MHVLFHYQEIHVRTYAFISNHIYIKKKNILTLSLYMVET